MTVRNLGSGVMMSADGGLASVLAAFDRPRSPEEALRHLLPENRRADRRRIGLLRRYGFLLPAEEARRKHSRIRAWKGNVASALHHSATRDLPYISESQEEEVIQERVLSRRRPALFKRYGKLARIALPTTGSVGADLEVTLENRRTVRHFSRLPVPLADFTAVVGGTWGQTGYLTGGLLGSLMTKTSPSAGALHPIECYIAAWNVRGLTPGLYHYDVGGKDLRRLRRGRFRAEAVRAASGQSWVGRAAFLCIMTAVIARSLWKYSDELTYRTLFLDAGHLAQTFCLLATARGLGPFTTAAIQDSFIEKLIGLDGVSEFPVYLCGAGVPAPRPAR